MKRVAVIAAPADAGLAGLAGEQPWGEARTVPAESASLAGYDPDLVVALGDAPLPPGAGRKARFAEAGGEAEPGVARLAPRGEGLWSRTPWPAADPLFDLAPADGEPETLVVGSSADRRNEVVGKLAAHDVPGTARDELTVAALERAAAVIVLAEEDDALPARAIAVLAARRLLVAPRCRVAFGLQAGIQFLGCSNDDDAVEYAGAALGQLDAFDLFRAMGAIAAERHRASVVYGRLAAALERAAGR